MTIATRDNESPRNGEATGCAGGVKVGAAVDAPYTRMLPAVRLARTSSACVHHQPLVSRPLAPVQWPGVADPARRTGMVCIVTMILPGTDASLRAALDREWRVDRMRPGVEACHGPFVRSRPLQALTAQLIVPTE
ncbi:MAG TPA: hypothetical protein VNQ81_03125 [Povalibacter sp.]|nr:hypothetical protein [Povalibacter sp.]